ncbi:TPA: hypothetical protein HA242_05420 [Candidatus Woesearchaeota archaeon]|nr:hypothetical protein [Candidatus Woesearchaeota archaeon]HIH13135.1 hypothetical protein [Candidatus Woesearchaeota archaeon]
MKEEIRKEILYDLAKAVEIMEVREQKDVEELKVLSDHGIEDVALHKDLDLISVTVLIYSLYKVVQSLKEEEYQEILSQLKFARQYIEKVDLGKYNRSIKNVFGLVQKASPTVREHLQDVMEAAKIKKGTALLQRGLSIGQAAGLMGLSNWDLQQYAAKTPFLSEHWESIAAEKRMMSALKIFGVK